MDRQTSGLELFTHVFRTVVPPAQTWLVFYQILERKHWCRTVMFPSQILFLFNVFLKGKHWFSGQHCLRLRTGLLSIECSIPLAWIVENQGSAQSWFIFNWISMEKRWFWTITIFCQFLKGRHWYWTAIAPGQKCFVSITFFYKGITSGHAPSSIKFLTEDIDSWQQSFSHAQFGYKS